MHNIKRGLYISRVKPYIGKGIIKVLVGARRTGKTYILYQIMDEIKKSEKDANIIFINKEHHEFNIIQNHNDLFQFVAKRSEKKKKNFVFIDEVQEIKDFEIALRELLVKDFDIYCTGSNASMLSSDIATVLSGRYIEIPIYSLSFKEFLRFHKLENNKEGLNKYIKYGGMPFIINLELKDEIIYHYLKNIYNTIVLKDIVSRYSIRDVDFIERLTYYISDNVGSYISAKKIAEFLKSQKLSMSIVTIQNYLKYLSDAFYIDKAPRYDIKGKRLFEINDKYYFRDLGLKHAIVPYKTGDVGKTLENMVYNHLIVCGYKVYVGKLNSLEIDFVALKNNLTVYIQVAYLLPDSDVIEREFGNLLAIQDNFRKIVVSADEYSSEGYLGVEHIHINRFLTEFE